MIYVGIDVAKDKHDCFITNSDGEILYDYFTIPNNKDGFDDLYQKISSVADDLSKIKVGLEPPDTTATTSWDFFLIKAYPPLSLTRYIPTSTEKA